MEYMCDIGYIVERADINFCALGNVVIQYFLVCYNLDLYYLITYQSMLTLRSPADFDSLVALFRIQSVLIEPILLLSFNFS